MLFSFVHNSSWIEEQLACNVHNFSMYNKSLLQSLASYFLCWSKWVCLLVKENICLWHGSTSPPKHPWLITEETKGKRRKHHPPDVFLAFICTWIFWECHITWSQTCFCAISPSFLWMFQIVEIVVNWIDLYAKPISCLSSSQRH